MYFISSANLALRKQDRSDKGHTLYGFINFKKIALVG